MKPSPIARTPLTDEDWKFSSLTRVPEKELVPCLLWEFLRESQTAQQLAQDWCAWRGHAARGEKDNQAELWARMKTLTINLNHKLNIPEFLSRAVGPAWGFGALANVPWQQLHPKIKQWLAEPCEQINGPVFIGLEMHVAQLADYTKDRFAEEMAKIPSVSGPVSLEKLQAHPSTKIPLARAPLKYFTNGPGWEALCVVVDFGRYDNRAIKDGFKKLGEEIAKTRPKGIKPQARTGSGLQRKAELRGMLNEMGLARLRGSYKSAAVLRTQLRPAYDQIAKGLSDKGTTAVQNKLDGARRRFLKRFHQVLPFEPKKSPPFCLR